MEILIDIIAVVLGITGIVGCIAPIIPGPPIGYVGLLVMYFWGDPGNTISFNILMILLAVTVLATILDYIVPAYFTKLTGGSKAAARGSIIGMILGIVFPPIGIIIGAFLGALVVELIIEGKSLGHSLKSALGSFIGFIAGVGIKLTTSALLLYYIIVAI